MVLPNVPRSTSIPESRVISQTTDAEQLAIWICRWFLNVVNYTTGQLLWFQGSVSPNLHNIQKWGLYRLFTLQVVAVSRSKRSKMSFFRFLGAFVQCIRRYLTTLVRQILNRNPPHWPTCHWVKFSQYRKNGHKWKKIITETFQITWNGNECKI